MARQSENVAYNRLRIRYAEGESVGEAENPANWYFSGIGRQIFLHDARSPVPETPPHSPSWLRFLDLTTANPGRDPAAMQTRSRVHLTPYLFEAVDGGGAPIVTPFIKRVELQSFIRLIANGHPVLEGNAASKQGIYYPSGTISATRVSRGQSDPPSLTLFEPDMIEIPDDQRDRLGAGTMGFDRLMLGVSTADAKDSGHGQRRSV